MPSYYISKTTGQLTQKQYDQDPRTGTLITNTPAPLGMIQASGAASQAGSTQVGQYNVQNYQLAALRGEYGPDAMRQAQYQVGMQTGRSIGGENQPSTPTPTGLDPKDRTYRNISDQASEQVRAARSSIDPRDRTYRNISDQASEQVRAKQSALSFYNPIDAAQKVVRTLYVPEGRYMQQELKTVKVGGSESGELAFYERLGKNEAGFQRMTVNPDTGALEPFMLIGGGGRGAAQSGMFSFVAATPAIYGRGRVQEGAKGLVSPEVMAPGLELSQLSGIEVFNIVQGGIAGQYDTRDYLARLGSEAYGGMVQFTDARTLGGITYEDRGNRAEWNLARYFDPLAVNRGKADLPGANIPWSVGEQTSPFFFMDKDTRRGEDAPAYKGIPETIAGYFPARGAAYIGGDVTGLGNRSTEPRVMLTGRDISFGDIKPYSEALGLGRLTGSKMVAGSPVITDLPGQVNTGQNASQLNSFTRKCNAAPQAAATGVMGGGASTKKMPGNVWDLTPENSGLSASLISKLQWGAGQSAILAAESFREQNRDKPFALSGAYGPTGLAMDVNLIAMQTASTGDFGKAWTAFNELGRRQTPLAVLPNLSGLNKTEAGRAMLAIPTAGTALFPQNDLQRDTIAAVGGAGVGLYEWGRTKPIEFIALRGVGAGYSTAKSGLLYGVGKAATSKAPVVAKAGQFLSKPAVVDAAWLAEMGMGGLFAAQAAGNIAAQPTAELKGKVAGETIGQAGAFMSGLGAGKTFTVDNTYIGRGMGPIERTMFKAGTGVRSLFTSDPAAYREVARISTAGRFIDPLVKAEPDLTVLSVAGKYAKSIKGTMLEQPHVMVGSSTVRGQYPKSIADQFGLRFGKDVDVYIESPQKAIASLSRRARITETVAEGVMDVHPIPRDYPGFKPSTEPETTAPETSFLSSVFGDPYRKIAIARSTGEVIKPGTEGYEGGLAYEAVNVQAGRKGQGAAAAIESPMVRGYRAPKDIYDMITIYQAQRAAAITRGASPKDFSATDKDLASFMGRTFEFGTEKGGGGKPVRMSVSDIVAKMSKEARQPVRGGKVLAVTEPSPSQGIMPSVLSGGIGSGFASTITSGSYMWSPKISGSPSPSARSRSAPSSIISPVSGIPSLSPVSSMRSPASSPRSITSKPSMPSMASSVFRSPSSPGSPSSPPLSPYSPSPSPRSPYSPVSSPPSFTPPYTPPGSPPGSPRSLPTGGMLGSGSRQGFTPRRNWRAENLVTSLEYLSQGFPGTFGKTTRKKAKRKGRK